MSIDTSLDILDKVSIKYPKKYKVFLLNDNYTTMDFVVDILVDIFHKSVDDAQKIMLQVHNNGKGLCGVYTYETASTKVSQVIKRAKKYAFPLKATMERE